jgi:hypothetical protein
LDFLFWALPGLARHSCSKQRRRDESAQTPIASGEKMASIHASLNQLIKVLFNQHRKVNNFIPLKAD